VEDVTKYWMALNSVRNAGPKTIQVLVRRFGSPEKVLSAPAIEIARLPRMNLLLAGRIAGVGKDLGKFEKLIARMAEAGIDVLCPDSYEYPQLLRSIDAPPPVLYKRGTLPASGKPTVAIVGTRFPTSDGAEAAEKIATGLADRGFVIVSGLAKGVDTAAHKGAIKAGGTTLAVLGSGLKMVYPQENNQLVDSICINGAVLSECHPNEVVSGQRLIRRNRIISGLSLGVILIEPEKGSLNTALWAVKQGRYIFVYSANKKTENKLPPPLPEKMSLIHTIDELDGLADRLRAIRAATSKGNGSEQACLLQIG